MLEKYYIIIGVYMSHKEAIVSCLHQNGKLNFSKFVLFLKRIRKVPFSLGNFNPEATPAVPGYRVSFANLFGSIAANCKSSKGQMIKPQSSLLNLP